ncbi:MAG: AraC family transcriptional regulator ligand-binding domain-containing protein [Myxococcales bacterium]|nr:AraC family transcriptional regulator ligand-binding domain-containing protein [Myxococcales bacterium]
MDIVPSRPPSVATRVPVASVHAAWREAEHLAGPDIGLLTARELHVGDMDPQGYVINAAQTLRDAIDLASRYHRIFYDNVTVITDVAQDTTTVRFVLLDETEVPNSLVEFAVAALCRMARFVFGAFPISEVRFRHRCGASLEALRQTFGCPVHLGADGTSVVLPSSALALRNSSGDLDVGHILAEHLQRELGMLETEGALAGRVYALLVRELPLRGTAAIDVARELNISERTLRRRLAEEGTSHRQLLEEARREVAIRLLGEQRLSIDEVAYHLGYAQPSSFQRAFKRWTGMPPATFRVRCGRASTMPPRAS